MIMKFLGVSICRRRLSHSAKLILKIYKYKVLYLHDGKNLICVFEFFCILIEGMLTKHLIYFLPCLCLHGDNIQLSYFDKALV